LIAGHVVDQNREERIAKSDPSARTASRVLFGYALPVLSVAIATGVTLLLQGYTFRTPLFFPAILLSTWFGGTGPGLLAVLLSALSINFFFLEPRFQFSFGVHDILHLAVFLFSAFLVSSWSNTRGRAERALRRARDELETRVRERTEDLSQSISGSSSATVFRSRRPPGSRLTRQPIARNMRNCLKRAAVHFGQT
jgi:K+-sensing histidine kinase KdpD